MTLLKRLFSVTVDVGWVSVTSSPHEGTVTESRPFPQTNSAHSAVIVCLHLPQVSSDVLIHLRRRKKDRPFTSVTCTHRGNERGLPLPHILRIYPPAEVWILLEIPVARLEPLFGLTKNISCGQTVNEISQIISRIYDGREMDLGNIWQPW